MAGIYVHIPFCRKACHYCDFHFSTTATYQQRMLEAIKAEAGLRKDWLKGEAIESVYLGGGTPSMLPVLLLGRLFDALFHHFQVNPDAEITLEANPDDLTQSYLHALKSTPVNRLSIGVQSFHQEHLAWMNRAHDATQAKACIPAALDSGFHNLTIDLIYGFSKLTNAQWLQNLNTMADFQVPHFSAYGLTIEKGTAFGHQQLKHKIDLAPETEGEQHFRMLQQYAASRGYRHYEISNFCKNDHFSRHNTSYWRGVPYLGLGPSAHSFNGSIRSWNVSNNIRYMQGIETGKPDIEQEEPDSISRFNELVMTRLRMDTGLDLNEVSNDKVLHLKQAAQKYIQQGWLIPVDHSLRLTDEGRLFADAISADLFLDRMA